MFPLYQAFHHTVCPPLPAYLATASAGHGETFQIDMRMNEVMGKSTASIRIQEHAILVAFTFCWRLVAPILGAHSGGFRLFCLFFTSAIPT
jgi:hypothetical protein